MPFIGQVIENVLPFVHRALITISDKADDQTKYIVGKLSKDHGDKVKLYWEDVPTPAMLTQERQKMLDKTYEDWVLFLDADDLWFPDDLKQVIHYLDADVDGLAVNPYQVVDEHHYDGSWYNKFFTKFFKNQKGVHYRHPWPRDLIYKDDQVLYWKENPRVPRIPVRYYHLPNIMNWRFRDEAWAEKYKSKIGRLEKFTEEEFKKVKKIFKIKNNEIS
jgi:glycosyltransferase involved in cell wall biosynthesis